MRNSTGTITAVPPSAPGTATTPEAPAAAGNADAALPDASSVARFWLFVFLVIAVVVALVWNSQGSTATPFDPAKQQAANFALFAGFYVAAQVIERALELVSPFVPAALPGWSMPADVVGEAAQAAQVKADRAKWHEAAARLHHNPPEPEHADHR